MKSQSKEAIAAIFANDKASVMISDIKSLWDEYDADFEGIAYIINIAIGEHDSNKLPYSVIFEVADFFRNTSIKFDMSDM